jgi:hypothetical protein
LRLAQGSTVIPEITAQAAKSLLRLFFRKEDPASRQ